MKTKEAIMRKKLLDNLSVEDLLLARSNRDWQLYDSLNEIQQIDMFINECRKCFGDLSEFEGLIEFNKISKDGIILFGKYKDTHISKVDNNYKLWAIQNIPSFKEELQHFN